MGSLELSFEKILWAVADVALVSPAAILAPGPRGRNKVNRARNRTVMLARRLNPSLSFGLLSRMMCDREPNDVWAMVRRGEERYRDDPTERQIVAVVLDRLGVTDLPPAPVGASNRQLLTRKIERLRRDLREAEAKLQQLHGAA